MTDTRHWSDRTAATFVAAIVISMGAVGLTASAVNASAAEESVLRIGFTQKIDHLNPLIGISDSAYVFYGLVYDSPQCVGNDFQVVGNLVTETRAVLVSDPAMVASGEPYGAVWEYTITGNASWHDGEPFTIEDLLFNLNVNAQNYEEMWTNQPYTYFMSHAEAVGEDTVRVHFYDRETGEPKAAAFAKILGMSLLPEHKVGGMATAYLAFDWPGVFEDETPVVVGTGPFMATPGLYDAWENNEPISLVRNPNYHWTADKGMEIKFDRIEMRFYSDSGAMANALEDGEVDVIQLPPEEFDALNGRVEAGELPDIETFHGLKCTNYYTEVAVNMNEDGPNMARLDPAVRQALAVATDKEHIVSAFYRGYAEPGGAMMSPIDEEWYYQPTASELYSYDLAAAGDILEAAGYGYPYSGATVRVATNDSFAVQSGLVQNGTELQFQMLIRAEFPEERGIAAYLQTQWASIGIDLNYVTMEETELAVEVYNYEYDLALWYWSSDIDPNYMLFCQSENAWDGWSDNMYYNEAYEENYSKSVSEMNPTQRKEYVDNCLRIHYRDAAYIILAYNYQTYAWRTDKFTGWGDWEADPGRSLDNFWTGNPLWFDLEPVKSGSNTMLYLAIGGAVAAAAAAVVVVRLRKMPKKK